MLTHHELVRLVHAVRNIGNGDFRQGERVVLEVSDRLNHAREKHPWPRDAADAHEAALALRDEADEVVEAVAHEGPERTREELFDTMAVAVRGVNMEWEIA